MPPSWTAADGCPSSLKVLTSSTNDRPSVSLASTGAREGSSKRGSAPTERLTMSDRAQPHLISAANRATPHDSRVHTYIGPILLHRRAQDPPVRGKIALGQRCHDTAAAGPGNVQANLVADSQCVADPGIFGKRLLELHELHHDVRTETLDLETPLWIELPQPVERGCRQQMDGRAIEERSRGQLEIGDRIPVVETLDVWPVLFGLCRQGGGHRRLRA